MALRNKCLRSRFQRWYSYRTDRLQSDSWGGGRFLTEKPGPSDWTRVLMVHLGEIIFDEKFRDDLGTQNGNGKSVVWVPLSFTWDHFCVTKSTILFPFCPYSLGLSICYFLTSFFPLLPLKNLFCSHFKSNTSSLQKIETKKSKKKENIKERKTH